MRILGFILALLVIPVTAFAGGPEDAAAERAKAALATFREEFKSEDSEARLKAVAELDGVSHALVVREIDKTVLTHEDLEIRMLGARVLGRMKGQTEIVGPCLRDHLGKNEEHPEVQVAIIRAIGRCGYRGARKELTKALTHCRKPEYEWVVKEVIRTIVLLDDKQMVVALLGLALVEGESPKRLEGHSAELGAGGGEKGTQVAKARYEAKHGKFSRRPKGEAEVLTIPWKDDLDRAVKKFTDQSFENGREFKKWLEQHATDFGLTKRTIRRTVPKL